MLDTLIVRSPTATDLADHVTQARAWPMSEAWGGAGGQPARLVFFEDAR